MELDLPSALRKALEREAHDARISLHAHILKKLERITPAREFIKREVLEKNLPTLCNFLNRVPSVDVISQQVTSDAYWWIKLNIDTQHPLGWHVVQAFAFVLNEISLQEKLPTVFMPVSPPPYLNGGPDEYLNWVIESSFNYIDPAWILAELEGRLPSPVEDISQWRPK